MVVKFCINAEYFLHRDIIMPCKIERTILQNHHQHNPSPSPSHSPWVSFVLQLQCSPGERRIKDWIWIIRKNMTLTITVPVQILIAFHKKTGRTFGCFVFFQFNFFFFNIKTSIFRKMTVVFFYCAQSQMNT